MYNPQVNSKVEILTSASKRSQVGVVEQSCFLMHTKDTDMVLPTAVQAP